MVWFICVFNECFILLVYGVLFVIVVIFVVMVSGCWDDFWKV